MNYFLILYKKINNKYFDLHKKYNKSSELFEYKEVTKLLDDFFFLIYSQNYEFIESSLTEFYFQNKRES